MRFVINYKNSKVFKILGLKFATNICWTLQYTLILFKSTYAQSAQRAHAFLRVRSLTVVHGQRSKGGHPVHFKLRFESVSMSEIKQRPVRDSNPNENTRLFKKNTKIDYMSVTNRKRPVLDSNPNEITRRPNNHDIENGRTNLHYQVCISSVSKNKWPPLKTFWRYIKKLLLSSEEQVFLDALNMYKQTFVTLFCHLFFFCCSSLWSLC